MKKLRNISWGAAALVAVTLTSCHKNLDEYNPGGATTDGIWDNPKNFVTAVNAAYFPTRYWYGKEDGVFMSETGTDLWYNNVDRLTFGRQLSRYLDFDSKTGYVRNTWKWLWIGINQCNTAIGKIDEAGFTDEADKNRRLGELRFLRAFYYWHIVETWGNVMFRDENTVFSNTATRAEIKDFYDLMISDLEFAKGALPNDWGAEYSRATKKSALGLLARVYLTRGYYPDANANEMFTKARDVAKEAISRATEFGVSMYPTPADLWKPANNKRNKEALFTLSNSSVATSFNWDVNGNKDHMFFAANYYQKPNLIQTKEYGKADNRYLMPTKHLLTLFGPGDLRYDATFQEKWYSNVDTTFQWYSPDGSDNNYKNFGPKNNKDHSVADNRLTIAKGDLALWISRTPIPNKKAVAYCAFDLDDIYDANGLVIDKWCNYPSLKKVMDPNRTVDVSSQAGYNDIHVIRLAEMYAVAGEAEFKLGNKAEAANQFNSLRTRAGAPTVTADDITVDFILDERAREFCGEHIRWFDLKRILRADEWANYIKVKNPNITAVKAFHWVRPVSNDEMNGLINATEFGQNTGYN
jgi:hypothetical protein